jgi:type I restriction enzyme, R subunit
LGGRRVLTEALPHTELAFEQLIVAEMTGAAGWEPGDPASYDCELGLYPDDAVAFVTGTQGKAWDRLVKLAGGEVAARTALLKRVAALLDRHGSVHVLRNGITERGVRFSLCQLRPAHSIDPETESRYEALREQVG